MTFTPADDDPGGRVASEQEAVRETYRRYAASNRHRRAWRADNPGNVAIRTELLAAVQVFARDQIDGDGRILDVGCGGGWWLESLARIGVNPARLLGVDLLAERVEAAKRRVPDADVRQGDAAFLPYPPRSVDLVLALTVLSSLSPGAAARVLFEVRRVLAPGAMVLVYEPRIPNPLNPSTRIVRRTELEGILGPVERSRSLTPVPLLTRRLGRATESLYPLLARIPPLRTHRLLACRVD